MQRKSKLQLLSRLALLGSFLGMSGCAVLHHVQVGTIDNRTTDSVLIPFEIKMNETGVSTEEIGRIAKATNSKSGDDVAGLAQIVAMFQMGPRTGVETYNEHYAKNLIYEVHQRCPSGQVTGLMSIREMRKYPAISGEIVKVTGYCRKKKVAPPQVGKIEPSDKIELSDSNQGDVL